MKPVIVYVDDQPGNLVVFEEELGDAWQIHTFTSPLEALSALPKLSPCIIVTDQRMPGLKGVDYLELAMKIHPNAIRIIITGYSEESLVVDAVRRAQIYDYIRKPAEPGELQRCVNRALEYYKACEVTRKLHEELVQKNGELTKLTDDLKRTSEAERALRQEIQTFVHPAYLRLLSETGIRFPLQRDLVGITCDVISGSKYHGVEVDGVPLLHAVIECFSKTILQHGGCRESLPGDSVYGHFGLWESDQDSYLAALATAQEFRVALRGLSSRYSVAIECGIAIHVAKSCSVVMHKAEVMTPTGPMVQKSFGTRSLDIDLLHRLEKEVHTLPGTNIIMSGDFLKCLKSPPPKLIRLGQKLLRGQPGPVDMHLLPSDLLTDEALAAYRASCEATEQEEPAKVERLKKAA